MLLDKGMGQFDLRAVLAAVACLCALRLVAEAQPATPPAEPSSPDLPPPDGPRPWADGVPESRPLDDSPSPGGRLPLSRL